MNKSELVDAVAQEAGMTKAAAEKAVSALTATIIKTVAAGDTVTLVGFGTFKPATRAARIGKNPKSGATITIPATTLPKFTAGAGFKQSVSASKSK